MSTTAQEPTHAQNVELPSGVQTRLFWRPPAATAAESFVTGFAHSSERFLRHPILLSAWTEQFTHRVGPWPKWTPLSFDLRPQASPPEGQSHRAAARTTSSAMPGVVVMRKATSTAVQQTTAPMPGLSAARPPSADAKIFRPALRLTVLRPLQAVETPPSLPHAVEPALFGRGGPSSFAVASKQTAATESPLPTANELAFEPRLVTKTARSPRKEVRGGFPTKPSSALPETTRPKAETVLSPTPFRSNDFSRSSAATVAAKAATTNTTNTNTSTAIEKLIERTVLPAALPGLEFRLIPPEQSPSSTEDKAKRSAASATPAPSPASPTPPATAPAVDINAVADKVYQTLMRRRQFERERKGLY